MKKILLIVSVVSLLSTTGCLIDGRHGHHHHWARAEMTSGPELVSSPAEVSSPPVATVKNQVDATQDDLLANTTAE